MATTNDNTSIVCSEGSKTISYHKVNDVTNKPSWSLRKWWGNVVLNSPFLRALCCYDAHELANIKQDELVRKEIRESMRVSMGYGRFDNQIDKVMSDVLSLSKVDLASLGGVTKQNENITRTYAQWEEYFASLGIDPLVGEQTNTVVVPRFAAAVCLNIRARVGRLQHSDANEMVVEREYLNICRSRNVRYDAIAAHRSYVLNAFFTEDVFEYISSTRTRLPMWLRDALDIRSNTSRPAVC